MEKRHWSAVSGNVREHAKFADRSSYSYREGGPMLLGRLNDHSGTIPHNVAIGSLDGRSLRYAELPYCLEGIRQWLADRSIEPGTRLAVVMSNGPELALTLLGAAVLATLSPLDPEMAPLELKAALELLECKGILTDPANREALQKVVASLGIPLHVVPFEIAGPLGRLEGVGLPEEPITPPTAEHIMLLHRTSGTTGVAKRVPLRSINISTQACNTAESLGLTHQDRILQVMPLFHMHGFGCLTGTLWSGGAVICTPGHDGNKYADRYRMVRPTWFSASPAILHDILRSHQADPRLCEEAPLRFIRSLSAAIPLKLIEELEGAMHAPVVEQYGLTEALSPVIANQPPPGPRKPGSIGRPFRNEVRIADEQGLELPEGSVGEILLRGPGIITAYAESPEVNARSWHDDWFRTGDLGSMDATGYIRIRGRLKEEINRGGEKIDPMDVEVALRDHPGVRAAAAFAFPHPTLGEDVAIAYVPVNVPLGADDLRRWMLERIAIHRVPKRFFAFKELPVTATGKVKRLDILRILKARGDLEMLPEPEGAEEAYERFGENVRASVERATKGLDAELPGSYVERAVALVWGQELGRDRLVLSDDFFLMGGDSLSGVRACSRLSEMLSCRIDLAMLFQHPILSEFAAGLTKRNGKGRWLNLAPIRIKGGLVPFICVHGDEGNYNLPRSLNEDRPFLGFMHQGEDGMGIQYRTIVAMARHYVNELLEAKPDGPYVLAGFSTGGVVAYAMAQRLLTLNKEVPLLVIMDARGPKFNWWRYAPRTKLADIRGEVLRPRCEQYLRKGQAIPLGLRNFYIINTYRRAVDRFRPKPYGGDVLFIRSQQRAGEPTGWGDLLTGNVRTETVKGEHLSIMREPHVRPLADLIKSTLRSAKL